MKTKRIVITGGPGSGKTTLIKHIEALGIPCMHEISRDVILEAQKQGIAQLFLEKPLLFSEKLLEGRLKQFHEGENQQVSQLFFDRGMPDITAYMDFIGVEYPDDFPETCANHKYDAVFLLPPWKEIYIQDNERYESFEQAKTIYKFLLKGYQKYNYTVEEVPSGTVEQRTTYILDKLKELF